MSSKDPRKAASPRGKTNTLEKKVRARAFLGKKNMATYDNVAQLVRPGAVKVGISPSILQSAALARRGHKASAAEGDPLAEYRMGGLLRSKELVAALARHQSGVTTPPPSSGAVQVARAILAVAIGAEAKGIRHLAQRLGRQTQLDASDLRRVEGIARKLGARELCSDELFALVPVLMHLFEAPQALGVNAKAILEALFGKVRVVAKGEAGAATAQQLCTLHEREACLVAACGQTGEKALAEGVVVLQRAFNGQLKMLDLAGVYKPLRGIRDPSKINASLPMSTELELKDYLAGLRADPPDGSVVRVLCGTYLSGATPSATQLASVPVLGGVAFPIW